MSSHIESRANMMDDDEISIAGFIKHEQTSSFAFDVALNSSSSRSHFVAWIFKVRTLYGFQALTTYLAVNYMDRVLSSRHLPQTGGWPLQLLSVACLSLAAKMEEPLVPSLLDLQVEGAKFIFEPKTIRRMELLVLEILDWRLQLVTPFTFISFFSYKLDESRTRTKLLMARSTEIILTNIQEASYLEYRPSSIAAAAILCAASELPSSSLTTPEHAASWCHGICIEMVKDCYRLMQQTMADHCRSKCIKVIPRLRVTAQINRDMSYIIDSTSSPSLSSSTSPPPSYNNKRRKLNNNSSWVDGDDY